MIAMDQKTFESDVFAIQLIAKGAYVDENPGYEKHYLVEVYVLRLNHIALNEWIMSGMLNCRECYEDGPKGSAAWAEHQTKKVSLRKDFEAKIIEDLSINTTQQSICITQALSEVFTVVCIS